MNNINKKYAFAALAAIIIIAVGFGLYNRAAKNKNQALDGNGVSQNGLESLEPGTGAPIPESAPTTTGSGSKKLSYGEAIKKYPFRFQFINCSANPGSMSVKRNTPVMLDNRDKTAHTIKANGQTLRIAGYDYQILYPKIEGESFITCDGGGSGKINVEK